MKKRPALLSVYLLAALITSAQDLGSWNILNLKYSLNNKWSLAGEAQLRSLKFYDHFHYYEVSGAVTYQPGPSLRWTLGGGSYQTYAEGGDFLRPKNQEEWRLWPQATLQQTVYGINIEHRYRFEFRFTDKGYRNRYRYRFGFNAPLARLSEQQKLQLTGFAEIFFTNREPYFERIRTAAGFNYRISQSVSFVTLYLFQYDYKLTDEIGRDFLVVGFYYEFRRDN